MHADRGRGRRKKAFCIAAHSPAENGGKKRLRPVVAQEKDEYDQWKSACKKKCSMNKYNIVVVSWDKGLLNLVMWQLKALGNC